MNWLRNLLYRRPDFGEAWGILVSAMMLAATPFAVLIGILDGVDRRDALGGLSTALFILISVAAVSALVGPFYLAWRDVLLKPTPPYFRTAYVVFVIGPGVPWIVLLALIAVVGGPAYPIAHLGFLSIVYEVEVVIGGWVCARMLAAEGLI